MFRWLYPTICELCGEAAETELCPDCLAALPRVPRPICLYCGAPVAGEQRDPHHCDACSGKPRSFAFARSALQRTEAVMRLVHALKYHKAVYLARALAPALATLWQTTPELHACTDWVLVPVPTTRRRLYGLGYNHARELAAALGKLTGLPLLAALRRRETSSGSQTRLTAAQRMHNAMQTYTIAPAYADGRRTLPAHLLVVDDVYTTGATVRACAKILRSHPGVQSVGVLTLVRA